MKNKGARASNGLGAFEARLLHITKGADGMVKGKMSLVGFRDWLVDSGTAEYQLRENRVDAVVDIGHIEAGSFAALYGFWATQDLWLVELAGYFSSQNTAWQALGEDAEAYSAVLFAEWVQYQYLTDKGAQVERLII